MEMLHGVVDVVTEETEEIVTCRECDGEIHQDDDFFVHDEDTYCTYCAEDLFCECDQCGETTRRETAVEVRNKVYCEYCRDDYLGECYSCGEYEHESYILRTQSGEEICEDCAQDYYSTCDDCGELVPEEEIDETFYGDYVCARCMCDYYSECEACGAIHRYGEDCPSEECESNIIHRYSYSPTPVFYGTSGTHFGVELEVESHRGSPIDIATAVDEAVGKWAYCKEDASLNYGVEIVTHPSTLEIHKGEWKEILNRIGRMAKSHDTTTCGLHVHIDRHTFSDQEHVFRFVFLIENFWPNFVRFSRRTQAQLERWAKRYLGVSDKNDDINLVKEKVRQEWWDRYRAVNLTGSSTVEVRIFRGTLKYESLIASIELLELLVEMTRGINDKMAEKITWEDIVLKAIDDYEFLPKYLEERALI